MMLVLGRITQMLFDYPDRPCREQNFQPSCRPHMTCHFHSGTNVLPNVTACASTGKAYVELLLDLDTLVGTDDAFLLGASLNAALLFESLSYLS